MSIRIKLILSYIAMLLIPLLLSLVAAVVIGAAYFGDVKEGYKIDFTQRSMEDIVKEEVRTVDEIRQTMVNHPDKLADVEYLNDLDKKLNVMNTGIIVEKNKQNIYTSTLLNQPELLVKLSQPEEESQDYDHNKFHNGDRVPVVIGNHIYSIQQFPFVFGDNSPGRLAIISDVSPIGSFARKFLQTLILAIILILVITNGVLTILISRSIIKPINALKYGAGQIKEGNLDFEVQTDAKDEIGQLCQAFEEMRCKLKESVELQLQYEENRKELIANISHDLKTPISSIKGYTEGIMDGVPDTPEKLDKYIQTIYSKAVYVDQLIDELFLFSKLDLKREPFNFERVEIRKYLQFISEDLLLDLNKRGIHFQLDPGLGEPVSVIVDRDKLKRVITNIIDNSIKYIDKQPGKIVMRLQEASNHVIIEIRDNGQGINQEVLPLIFDRFYRVDPSRNSAIQGTGLGLAIARRIIEEHNGVIWAESEEGIGTSIFFTLKKEGQLTS